MKFIKFSFILFVISSNSALANKNELLLSQGKNLYNQHCLMCHGATGAGDGPVGSNLSKKILPFKKLTEKQVVDILNAGKKDVMPDYRAILSADQKQALAKYITESLLDK